MTIRIFNPEHDIALAEDKEVFASPHAGRQLRYDLSFLPALWSEDGDVVVVDDVDVAETGWRSLRKVKKSDVSFLTMAQVSDELRKGCHAHLNVDVWGWDAAIRHQLLRAGVPETIMPTRELLAEVRRLSSRRITVRLLQSLRDGIDGITCGVSSYVTDKKVIVEEVLKKENIVVKAPWSSSGRGVRYLIDGVLSENTINWITNTIRKQGGVMVEPLYNKVKDFGMEFVRQSEGSVRFVGLSLFDTRNGSYTGNLLATEQEKRDILSRYVSLSLLDGVISRLEILLADMLAPLQGLSLCLGVDMMVVAGNESEGFLLHPCVEVNLRRTMGHVALRLQPSVCAGVTSMNITFENKKYHLRLR